MGGRAGPTYTDRCKGRGRAPVLLFGFSTNIIRDDLILPCISHLIILHYSARAVY